jgi:5-methyltetrahydrofolate--homocysteine methyltransferase
VIGTIDEDGMGRTKDKKFEIAERAYNTAIEYGIPAHELFFDTLALPISTGIEEDRQNGKATIESIKLIREKLPGCHVLLGISNISFGLNPAARQILNSIFLYEAVQAGLDGAIVSANKILPLTKIEPEHQKVCRDLIYDLREFDKDICTYDPLMKLTELFLGKTTKKDATKITNLSLEERLKQHIIDGERVGFEETLKQALKQYTPLDIINIFLLDGMKVVGELFSSGQMQLPFVLQSAQTMKAAVAFLEPFMDQEESGNDNGKGKFIIATVKGDVHDIGKNLVDIILSNNGYKVINLGIKQPVENIIQAYEEHKPDCIAMSGLLVKSTAFMKDNLEIFNDRGINVPVILGGAALTPKFVYEDCQNTYQGKVVYGKDAFSDLSFMDTLMPAKLMGSWNNLQGFSGEFKEKNSLFQQERGKKTAEKFMEKEAKSTSRETPQVIDTKRSEDVKIIDPVSPPFWGTKILNSEDLNISEIFWYLDLQALIAGQWQFRKPKEQSREEYHQFLVKKVYPILEDWKQKIITENLLHPTVTYGYFPCQSEGNQLLVYDPEIIQNLDGKIPKNIEPIWIIEFPRQKSGRRLCIADFFTPKELGLTDVFPMQAVTVGEIATEYAQKLFADNDYTNYLYFHGMAVQTAEALAEYIHSKIRRELGFGEKEPDNMREMLQQHYQGSRYSFGYPACPNIQNQYKQLEVLGCNRINMYMDESEQMYPEQSTTAIITYHPVANYFSA